MEKRIRKIQALMTEDEVTDLHRILFWDQTKGSPNRSLSSLVREILLKEIQSRPAEDLQPVQFRKK